MRKVGRIIEYIEIENAKNPEFKLACNALVDTGSAFVVLPMAWKEQLGELHCFREVSIELANQSQTKASVYGPVMISIRGFPTISSEVLFVEMEPRDGKYEPLIGYIPLEQAQAAVDMLGHRLVPVKYVDLKKVA